MKKQFVRDRTLLNIILVLLVLLCFYSLSLNSTNLKLSRDYNDLESRTTQNTESINQIQTMVIKDINKTSGEVVNHDGS